MAKEVTLQDIKARPLREIAWKGYMETCLDEWNIGVYRRRMESEDGIRRNISTMVRYGNEPLDNEEMLDRARWFVEKEVYTDEQWEEHFLPAINGMIAYNDAFVRWLPGYVVRSKMDGSLWLVMYDYATAFGAASGRKCRDFTSLALVRLHPDGRLWFSRAWEHYDYYELVDRDHCEENIAWIRDWHVSNHSEPPYHLDSRIVDMYYK